MARADSSAQPVEPDHEAETGLEALDPARWARIQTVIELWSRGWSTSRIIQELMNRYSYSPRTAYRDFELAKAEMAKEVQINRKELMARSVTLMDGIIRQCMTRKDFFTAIKAAQHRDRVLKLTSDVDLPDEPLDNAIKPIGGVTNEQLAALGDAYADAADGAGAAKPAPVRKAKSSKSRQPKVQP